MLKWLGMMSKLVNVVIAISLALAPCAYAEDETALNVLNKMAKTMDSTSYKGTLVYLHDSHLESMRVLKKVEGDVTYEKVYSLNGEAREIIKNNDQLICVTPHDKKMTVEPLRKSPLPFNLPRDLNVVKAYYDVKKIGVERIAGKLADVLELKPKDDFRYGYKFWVSKKDSLMLKRNVIKSTGSPIEQMMFTDIDVTNDLSSDEFHPSQSSGQFDHVNVASRTESLDEAVSKWHLSNAPVGYALVSQNKYKSRKESHTIEHLFVSDGLASVSVFIEPVGKYKKLEGTSRMGALNAYGLTKQNYSIVAIGNAPLVAVKFIGDSILPSAEK